MNLALLGIIAVFSAWLAEVRKKTDCNAVRLENRSGSRNFYSEKIEYQKDAAVPNGQVLPNEMQKLLEEFTLQYQQKHWYKINMLDKKLHPALSEMFERYGFTQ